MTFAVLTRIRHGVGTYGPYLAEICRSEGLAGQLQVDLDTLPPGALDAALRSVGTIVTGGGCPLWNHEIATILKWVRKGATLVAVRPSRRLAKELGLGPVDRQVPDCYLAVEPREPETAGLIQDAVQTLVTLDRYEPAMEFRTLATTGPHPAVFEFRLGRGRVVVFGYDVGRAVARLRHGDPELAGTRSQGDHMLRSTDLMLPHLDRSAWHHPQADLHTQLLTNVIVAGSPVPVPRWWYYPEPDMRTLVIQDSDDDWSTPEQFRAIAEGARGYGVTTTFYLMMGKRPTALDDAAIGALEKDGHSFGIHHDGVPDWEDGDDQTLILEQAIRDDVDTFRRRFGRTPVVNRNHALAWFGTDHLPRLYAELGIAMEFNALGPVDGWLCYVAGSSRPIRHVATDGTVLDVFQQPTTVYDDVTLVDRLGGSPEEEAELVRQYLARLQTRGHGPVSMQSHPVSFATYSRKFFELVWGHARSLGIDIWNAESWARYTLARYASTIELGQVCKVKAVGTTGRQTLLIPSRRGTMEVHGLRYRPVVLDASPEGISHTVALS